MRAKVRMRRKRETSHSLFRSKDKSPFGFGSDCIGFLRLGSKTLARKRTVRPSTESRVFAWFGSTRGRPTAPQAEAWPLIQAGKNVLIASPTGTGKTFAA